MTFHDKTLLITGGTGTFGNAVLGRFLHTDIAEIRIFSRDEKKQDDMRRLLQQSEAEVLHRRCPPVRQPADCRCAAWTTFFMPRP